MPDLPGSLRLTSTFPFVGRAAELETLRTLMPRGRGRGPPRRPARRRARLGQEPPRARVRRARRPATARSSSTAPATRSCARRTGRSSRRSTTSREPPTRPSCGRRSAPAAASSRACSPTCPSASASSRRRSRPTRTPSATGCTRPSTDLLAGVTRARPVLLVLEDGHWADAPTLLLLRHLARAAGNARVLLLATFRDTEADVPEALSETLADLRRSDDVVRLRLAGLSDDEVAEFVAQRRRRRARPRAARARRRRSATSPRATRSWSASSGARSSRPAPSRWSAARSG